MFAITVFMFVAFVLGLVVQVTEMISDLQHWNTEYIQTEYPEIESLPFPTAEVFYEESEIFPLFGAEDDSTAELIIPNPKPHVWNLPTLTLTWDSINSFPEPGMFPMPIDAGILARMSMASINFTPLAAESTSSF